VGDISENEQKWQNYVMANNIECKSRGEKIPLGSVLCAVASGLRPVSTSGRPVIRREPMPSAEITSPIPTSRG
jgi:hypothetical protein